MEFGLLQLTIKVLAILQLTLKRWAILQPMINLFLIKSLKEIFSVDPFYDWWLKFVNLYT